MSNVKIEVRCRECGEYKTLEVDSWAYYEWKERQILAQDAFPHLDADDRELLISNTCGQCWNNLFNEEEPDPVEFGPDVA